MMVTSSPVHFFFFFFLPGLLSWDLSSCHVDLEKELKVVTEAAPPGEELKAGDKHGCLLLINFGRGAEPPEYTSNDVQRSSSTRSQGFKDLDLGNSRWWVAIEATYCPSRPSQLTQEKLPKHGKTMDENRCTVPSVWSQF